MNLTAIVDYLVSVGSLKLKKGTNLFASSMPAECQNGVLLLGPYHGSPINHELRGLVRTEFTFIVRATDWDKGDAQARAVIKALTTYGDRKMGSILVKQLLPLNEPRDYRRSAGGFWEFEVDNSIVYTET